ncbi:Fic family protein [bacterium]|nr:Fic family protein [bacterium]
MFDPILPYNDLPPLPPKGELETKEILKKVISASRSLSELKGAITNLPNPLLFIDTINLKEAKASSEIENIITTQDELFKASIAEKKVQNSATKEVIHYKDALWHGYQTIKKKGILTTNTFVELVQIIKENNAGIRKVPGTQLKNPVSGEVIYTPPEGENIIRSKLQELEEFIHAEDNLDHLIRLALIHYQFEAIHPFYDGNGRTGRIVLLLYLQLTGLLEIPALYLSGYILENRGKYYSLLREVTEKDNWEPWILYVLDMIEVTSTAGRKLINEIEVLMSELSNEIQEVLPRVYSRDLIEVIFRLPYTKRSSLVDAGIGNAKTAGSYLQDLEEAGIMTSEMVGKEKLYLNTKLIALLKERK